MSFADQAITESAEPFTQEEIHQTFEKLGLTDPETRRRLLELAAAAEEQPRIGNWLHADAGTESVR